MANALNVRPRVLAMLLTVGALVLGLAGPAVATTTGTIKGEIYLEEESGWRRTATAGEVAIYYSMKVSETAWSDYVEGARTVAGGDFTITGLEAGDYRLYFEDLTGRFQNSYRSQYSVSPFAEDAIPVTLAEGATVNIPTKYLPEWRVITGHVNLEGAGSATAGQVRVTTSVRASSGAALRAWVPALTDAAGDFRVAVPPDQYSHRFDFELVDPSGTRYRQGSREYLTATDVTLTVPLFSTVSGHIDLGRAGNSAGPGLTVQIAKKFHSNEPLLVTTTDEHGDYFFGDLRTDELVVTAWAPGHYGESLYVNTDGTDMTVPNLILPEWPSLRGTVTDRSGVPLPGIAVYVDKFDLNGYYLETAAVQTDASGQYVFTNVGALYLSVLFADPEGRYASGYLPKILDTRKDRITGLVTKMSVASPAEARFRFGGSQVSSFDFYRGVGLEPGWSPAVTADGANTKLLIAEFADGPIAINGSPQEGSAPGRVFAGR